VPSLREDQASGLRKLFAHTPHPVAAFVSIEPEAAARAALACASALAQRAQPPLLIDTVGHSGSVSELIGTHDLDLADALNPQVRLEHILIELHPHTRVLPAARALNTLAQRPASERLALARLLRQAEAQASASLVQVDATEPDHPLLTGASCLVVCMPLHPAGLRHAHQLIKNIRPTLQAEQLILVATDPHPQRHTQATMDNFCSVLRANLSLEISWTSLSDAGAVWPPLGLNDKNRACAEQLAHTVLSSTQAMTLLAR
jgi:hypothetical protein